MAWKYQDVLNADLAILLTIAIGFLSLVLKIYKRGDSTIFTTFLFKFALASSVIQGLGLKTNLYNGDIWRFVGAFLVLRAIMLLGCTLFFGVGLRRSLGDVVANWMSTTWISTVILGTPILKALLGPSYANLGVVAGVSSFIFQLPVMLILFEIYSWRQEHLYATLPQSQPGTDPEQDAGLAHRPLTDGKTADCHAATEGYSKKEEGKLASSTSVGPPSSDKELMKSTGSNTDMHKVLPDQHPEATPLGPGWSVGYKNFRLTQSQLKGIGLRLVHNHVLWGCFIGMVLSLSKIGPRWLDPGNPPTQPNCKYAIGAGFIAALLTYFSNCTEPIALFATGMWMQQKNPLGIGLLQAGLYMLVKLVLVPTLMVGCAFMVGLDGAYGRAAVLVAALPVSSATFALCKTYSVGEPVAVSNTVLGNLLVLPTTIAWLSFMDAVNLFDVGTVGKVPDPCNA